MTDSKPRGPYKQGGERGPNVNPRREPGFFSRTIRARKEFLRVYAATGSIAEGAGFIGVSKEVVYQYRNANPAFATLMEKVRRKFRQSIEAEIHRRGVVGWLEPVYNRQGEPVGDVRKYSDRLLELLAKRNVGAYVDKVEVEATGTVTQLDLNDLRALSKDGRAKLRQVLEELGSNEPTIPEAPEGG